MCELVCYDDANSMSGVSTILWVSDELLLRNRCITSRKYSLLTVRLCNKNSWCTKRHCNSHQITFDRTWSAFFGVGSFGRFPLAWLGFGSQCHSPTAMIRHQLWPFWANLYGLWTSLISPGQCPCATLFLLRCLTFHAENSRKNLLAMSRTICQHHQ